MGKHEIRLRRQRITARGSERFRNYGAILKQHEEERKIKLIVRIFTFFLIIVALVILFITLSRWEENQTPKATSQAAAHLIQKQH
ncbi:MAG: hypothetical protein MUF39_03305 [Cyclobacteriaceae bacterium]|jgi:hypothetical protein|nr:hypothetical protein [Cyclobacteriaceae bacterium]